MKKVKKYLFVIKERIANILWRYRAHFCDASLGRRREYRLAKKEILRHPYWIFQPEPDISQDTPVGKMIFSMLNGPIWRYEATHDEVLQQKIQTGAVSTRPITQKEVKDIIKRQQERQRTSEGIK